MMVHKHAVICASLILLLTISQNRAQERNSKLYDLVYKNFLYSNYDKCIRVLNGTNQVGCQSSQGGNYGVLYLANTSSRLAQFLQKPNNIYYILLVNAELFDRSVVFQMKSRRVQGILLYEPDDFQPPQWSPDLKCPTERVDVYNSSYGPAFTNCQNEWNMHGDGLVEENIPFPIFFLRETSDRDTFIKCYNDYNLPEVYPLCAAELTSFMYGALDTVACLKRSQIETSLKRETYCQIIGGRNLISSLKTYANASGSATPVILVTSPIDSRSLMMSDYSPGANEATGFITLLAVAQALGQLPRSEKRGLKKDVLFVLYDGEAFDNIGSNRLVYDINADRFPFRKDSSRPNQIIPPQIKLEDLNLVVELRQLGLTSDKVFVHFDPISYQNSSIKNSIDDVVSKLNDNTSDISFVPQSTSFGLPPSSFSSILKQRKMPGVVLSDYHRHFSNERYFSVFDTLRNLKVRFDKNATDNEVMAALQPLAENLASISTEVAKALYRLASDDEPPESVKANSTLIAQMLFCYLHKSDCELFLENIDYFAFDAVKRHLSDRFFNRYASVFVHSQVSPLTNITKGLLTRFVGEILNPSVPCSNPNPNDDRIVYNYLKGSNDQPVCVLSSTYQMPAYNPYLDAVELQNFGHLPGMWSESQWGNDSFNLRMFLVQSPTSQLSILVAGLVVFVVSILLVYYLNAKAHILFPHDPTL